MLRVYALIHEPRLVRCHCTESYNRVNNNVQFQTLASSLANAWKLEIPYFRGKKAVFEIFHQVLGHA
jgi:hypothetical protein